MHQPNRSKTAIRSCPVCDNRSVDILHHQKFVLSEGHTLPKEYDVVWCHVCGFSYADTPATQEDYDRYYAAFSKYEDSSTSTGGGGSEWDARRLRETAEAVAAMLPDKDSRIVDIGCANGGLLAELQKLGFRNLLGVDPSPACVRNTQNAYGIEAAAGSFRAFPNNIGRADVVLLSHVLEHVRDLRGTVANLLPLLNPGGLLYIEVPDASRYTEFLVAPFQDFNTEHINHFGPSSLRGLFEAHGLALAHTGQKTVESSAGFPYPAVFAFFRAADGAGRSERKSFHPDLGFREQLLAYIEASREKIQKIDERLAQIKSEANRLIVWGTGQLTMKLLAETSLARLNIIAFVDGNPINQGKTLADVPVLAPQWITDDGTPILIATLLHHREIAAVIRDKLKLRNPLITLD